ncbi:hypothetical protein CD351_10980 [Erythrobacter sp. KY5]|uniref:hypothetical protein n=1 Tax=Erythrobacter sp. KY5 TaxID=2011159 RepID=UPI000DBEF6D0|nr:hypothetical protein [Erythrobacter sp. KY5]AWW74949.1 hypothetical protein CD351_10980 [Erythrobacter sp. KY5]
MSNPERLPTNGEFSGMARGDVLVPAGADIEISGMIGGDVIVEAGAKAHISGMVRGKVIDLGGEVRVTGMTG